MSENENNLNEVMSNNRDRSMDGTYFLYLLFKYKWFVIITVTIATVASAILSLQMDNWYSATVNAVPSKSQGSLFDNMIGGGISSALKEFGMTKLGGGGGDAYDFIVLMQSRTVKDSLIDKYDLAKEYDIPDTARSQIYAALDDNLEVTYEKEGNYTISVLSKDKHKAVDMVNYFIDIVNALAQRVSREDAARNKEYLINRIKQTDSVLVHVGGLLSVYSKKNMLFSPEDQAKSVGTAYSELKSELIIQGTKLDMIKNMYGENDAYTKMQQNLVNSLSKIVEEAKTRPGFAGNFAMENATEVAIEYMKLQAELETFTKVKSLLLPMLEEAKLQETKNTNSLIIIDKPIPADKKAKPKRSIIVLGFMFGTFILCSIFIVILDSYKNFLKKYRALKNS
jgi:capsule polysaccharide export protein KpsE/RkpR